jgi:hypothetical protein
MTATPSQHASASRPLHLRVYRSGVIILVIGLVSAALLYFLAPEDPNAAAAREIGSGRAYEYNVERIGGTAAVYTGRLNQWLDSLWHGKQLAATVAVLTVVVALLCFLLARMIAVRSPSRPPRVERVE